MGRIGLICLMRLMGLMGRMLANTDRALKVSVV
jgi:hypothetical protein